jgi:eukaryotic-like serine/threonine-protein kinase
MSFHAQVREIFLKALELPPGEREAFLERAGADKDVMRQVRELLNHSSPHTVLNVPLAASATSQRLSLSRFTPLLKFLTPFASSRVRQWVTGLALLALLGTGGQMLRTAARGVAQGQAFSVLNAVKSSTAEALLAQLEEWRSSIEVTVSPSIGGQAVRALLKEPSEANNQRFHQYAASLLSPGRFDGYFFVSTSGTLVGYNGHALPPSPATPFGMSMFGRAINSRKTVIGVPTTERTMVAFTGQGELLPSITFYLPIFDEGGEALGVFCVRHSIDPFFSALRRARMFQTAESFVFTPDGLMLSPSRFQKDLQGWGLADRPKNAGGLPTVYLRDPGRALAVKPLTKGEQPSSWAGTLLVRTVNAASKSHDPKAYQGTLAEPYRDYRGQLVVSSWRWLPELGIGLANEIDTAEINRIPNMLDRVLLSLFGLIGLGGLWAVVSSGWLVRMRGEVARQSEMGVYSLIEKIGEGGMGEVYLARHALLKRTAALKLLRRDRSDPASFSKFENEVRVASHLRHPNTVEVYDFGRAKDGTFYFAMQYLPGADLADWVKRGGKMPVERTIHIVRQICSALSEAHEEGHLHCDVKPSNVMLCSMGGLNDFVKLLDFGLAMSLRNPDASTIAEQSGTAYYTAPERLRADAEVDGRSDIYSLGVLWFYLLTARLPHGAGVHWVEATLTMDAAPVSSFVTVDAEVEELVASCMAREAEARPASTAVLLRRLNELARRLPWTEEEAAAVWRT